MRKFLVAICSLFFLYSCNHKKVFPEKIAERMGETEMITYEPGTNVTLNALLQLATQFKQKKDSFNLDTFETKWQAAKGAVKLNNRTELAQWIEMTGLLLELTQKEKYAAEMERIGEYSAEASQLIEPFIYTKNTDNIYVNIFEESEISYHHSMKGEVTIKQITENPKEGSVKLVFGMTEQRYLELGIRIPVWAKESKVTVKGVKYFAPPGGYCHIVKKWREGDVVEIEFPKNKH